MQSSKSLVAEYNRAVKAANNHAGQGNRLRKQLRKRLRRRQRNGTLGNVVLRPRNERRFGW